MTGRPSLPPTAQHRWHSRRPAPSAVDAERPLPVVPLRKRRVLCVTPLGLEGRGGIDRLYLYLRRTEAAEAGDTAVRYLFSRGEAPGALWIPMFPARLASFAAVMATWRPDVVHVNFANGGSLVRKWAMIRVARLFGCPVIIHFHCVFDTASVRAGRLVGRLMTDICRSAAEVVAIGQAARRDFIVEAGVDPARVHVIANGAPDIGSDLPLPKHHDTVEILFAGQVGPRKGTSVLVAALAALRDVPGWTCTIAGDGDVEACRAEVRAAGLDGLVRITGWIASDGVHALMRRADIVVLPSDREVMPMSLIEGAAAGAALLATPVGEIRDMIEDGGNGFLVDRRPETLADRLRRLLDDRDLLARMQVASRERYEASFRIEVFAARIRALYRWAVPGR